MSRLDLIVALILLASKAMWITMIYTSTNIYTIYHGLRTPGEEIAFTAQLKIHSQSNIFKYGRSIFCLPPRPKFSDFFDLCLHLVSVVRDKNDSAKKKLVGKRKEKKSFDDES